MFQFVKSAFMLLGSWKNTINFFVVGTCFDENYVILMDSDWFTVHVYFANGEFFRRIESRCEITSRIGYHNGKIVIGGEDKILRVWDVETGLCLKELRGHNSEIKSVWRQKENIMTRIFRA